MSLNYVVVRTIAGVVEDTRNKYTCDVAYKVTIQTFAKNKRKLFSDFPKHLNKVEYFIEKSKKCRKLLKDSY